MRLAFRRQKNFLRKFNFLGHLHGTEASEFLSLTTRGPFIADEPFRIEKRIAEVGDWDYKKCPAIAN